MKSNHVILIVFLILLATGGGLLLYKPQPAANNPSQEAQKDIYYCPMHPQYTSDRPGICPICSMKLVKKEGNSNAELKKMDGGAKKEKKIFYWTDPMIPGYKASGPGKSPMNIDLVPVYSEAVPSGGEELNTQKETSEGQHVAEYSTISIDTHKQQLMGVKTMAVTKKPLVRTIHAYGYVAHDLELYEAQLDYLGAWRVYNAFQKRRPVRDEFRSDWREYYINPAMNNRWRSDEKLKAQERLLKVEYELIHMGITPDELQQLRETKYGRPWIQPDLLFFEKGFPYWVYANVFESDLGFLAVTQKVSITIPAYGETTEGVIRSIPPIIDPATRTARVRIELPNYRGQLSVNMFVNVDIPVELDESLVIPRDAMMDTGLRKIAFVQIQEGIFEPRQIQTGFEGDGMVAVKSGLKEGEIVVSSGNFLIDSESRLQAALEGMGAEGGHQHGQ